MSISVSCPCGKTLSVKDELAGKRGKCPKCGALLTIPQLPQPSEPELLDLPSLSTEFDAPVEEQIPEVVRQARARAGWVDPNTEFKVAGDPLSDDVGKVFAPSPAIAPLKAKSGIREEKEGEFVCPRCGCGLENTYSLLNILVMFASSATTGFYLRPTTPYLCRVCDAGIRYEDLRGASRRTADRRAAKFKLGCLIAFLTFGGLFGGCYMVISEKIKVDKQQQKERLEQSNKEHKEWQQKRAVEEKLNEAKRIQAIEQRKLKDEQQRKEFEEQIRKRSDEERKRLDAERAKASEKAALPPSSIPPLPIKPMPTPANPFQPAD